MFGLVARATCGGGALRSTAVRSAGATGAAGVLGAAVSAFAAPVTGPLEAIRDVSSVSSPASAPAQPLESNSVASGITVETLPIIDMEKLRNPRTRAAAAEELKDMACGIGFCYVVNHNVSGAATLLDDCRAFFDLPMETKMGIHLRESTNFRGYSEIGEEMTNGLPDRKETFDLGLSQAPIESPAEPYMRLRGPNQWPPTDSPGLPPGWQARLEQYMTDMTGLGSAFMTALAEGMGLPEADTFARHIDNDPFAMLRLIHYVPADPDVVGACGMTTDDMPMGIGEHCDFGCLTFIVQDKTGGLQVQNASGNWVNATPMPGSFVVNFGDMVQLWTDNYVRATSHRVRLADPTAHRYSAPFFLEPSLDTVVAPIDLPPSLLPYPGGRKPFGAVPDLDYPKYEGEVSAESGHSLVYGRHMWNAHTRSYPEIDHS